jgi:hypothetical protein
MKKLRDQVFIWPSWICKLVAGEEQCEWKYWLKAHYFTDKKPGNFNLATWTVQHAKAVRARRVELEKLGYKVYAEDQNSFKYEFKPMSKEERVDCNQPLNGFTISGKADIVGIKADDVLVDDCKTGSCKTSDFIQVVFYMLFLPLAHTAYFGKKFRGNVIYKDGVPNAPVPANAVDDRSLVEEIWRAVKLVAGEETGCRRVPSTNECKRCDIMRCDCPVRVDL